MESLSKLKNAPDKFNNINVSHDFTKDERTEIKGLVKG